MKTLSPDTAEWAEEKHLELLRRAGITGRLALARSLSAFAFQAARVAARRRLPHASEAEREEAVLASLHGPELAARICTRRKNPRAS